MIEMHSVHGEQRQEKAGISMTRVLILGVTVVEHAPSILKTVDASLGKLVSDELERHGISVVTSVAVEHIVQEGTQLKVKGNIL